ncbi:MAG: hypothetical protein DLM52_06735 [Chthoniobacterales bacterium]|nr:MAG: hypothetical protein DLM52_06735 [Chthoniobacterales bacterium]
MAFAPDKALHYLRRAHRQERLAHAYLISGPAGSGKSEVAAGLAAALNNTTPEAVLNARAADVFLTEPGSRSRRIVVDQIRTLERALQLRTDAGRKKIAIIRDADRMQAQAANAFLKTLEEPPPNSLLLLLTTLPEALPDTIVSRCLNLALRFSKPAEISTEEKELQDILCRSADAKSGTVESAYRVSQAIAQLLDSIRASVREENGELLKGEEARYRNTTDGAWLSEREDYYKALSESMYRERRSRLIETLFSWWADVLRVSVGLRERDLADCAKATAKIAARFSPAEILQRLRRLEEMRDQLNTNAGESLVLEVACLRLFA